jgi:hypothetical protein
VDAVSLTVLDDATGRAWATSAMDESFFAELLAGQDFADPIALFDSEREVLNS